MKRKRRNGCKTCTRPTEIFKTTGVYEAEDVDVAHG